jgi:hypothetical protein
MHGWRVVRAFVMIAAVGAFLASSPTPASAAPHHESMLRCSHGEVIAVALSATPATVAGGQNETITASARNCTRQTQAVSEVDETIKAPPCTNVTSAPSPDTFAPRQQVSNTFPIPTSSCPGTWGLKVDLYQATVLIATAQVSWTVTA